MPFWVRIRGVSLYLDTTNNVRRSAQEIGEFIEMKDLSHARGILRVRVNVNTSNPLVTGVVESDMSTRNVHLDIIEGLL